ncbi:MAG: hypothetical protein NT037_14780 [Hyphomicrobiales bacterium]|nr:hypothetical protein [Hyphomicrobiales bacterium]
MAMVRWIRFGLGLALSISSIHGSGRKPAQTPAQTSACRRRFLRVDHDRPSSDLHPANLHIGFFHAPRAAQATIASGDIVTIDTLTGTVPIVTAVLKLDSLRKVEIGF